MKRLIDTQLLKLLNLKGTVTPADIDLTPMYDDFVHSAISICTTAQGDVSAYFTLHYTRLELEEFQSKLNTEGAGKKCTLTTLRPEMYLFRRNMPTID